LIDDRVDWALSICARVLRPLIRLSLNMGLKHRDLEQVVRDLLLDEARRSWRAQGVEPNISQLSITTGLNRKAVTTSVRASTDALPHTDMSAASKTLTAWLELVATLPDLKTLPVTAAEPLLSFELLARRASRGNHHHRAVLDELTRLHMVEEKDGRATLAVAGFVPADDVRSMLAFLGDNARDHLLAGVSNTFGQSPLMLERSVFASGLTLEGCVAIQKQMRFRWDALHHELAGLMTQAVDAAEGRGSARIRVGVYAYHEERTPEPTKPAPAAPSDSASAA
jgi:hypothetical protein